MPDGERCTANGTMRAARSSCSETAGATKAQVASIRVARLGCRSKCIHNNRQHETCKEQRTYSADFGEELQIIIVSKIESVLDICGLISQERALVCAESTTEHGITSDQPQGVAPDREAVLG